MINNLQEVASLYSDARVSQVINVVKDAIANAYREGYKAGYEDGSMKITSRFTEDHSEYVDLGLPSGTLWSKDYIMEDNSVIYLPFCKAMHYRLPTEEQMDELDHNTFHRYVIDKNGFFSVDLVGPNGNFITVKPHGRYLAESLRHQWRIEFWLDSVAVGSEYKYVDGYYASGKVSFGINKAFSGYKLPVRTVR